MGRKKASCESCVMTRARKHARWPPVSSPEAFRMSCARLSRFTKMMFFCEIVFCSYVAELQDV